MDVGLFAVSDSLLAEFIDSSDVEVDQLVWMLERTMMRRSLFSETRCVTRELARLRSATRCVTREVARPSISRSPMSSPKYFYSTEGTLRCRNMDCMFIASFGDKFPMLGEKVAKKIECKNSTFLPGVRGDLENVQAHIRRDKTMRLRYVYADYPGIQRSKSEYLQYIKKFLSESKDDADGGAMYIDVYLRLYRQSYKPHGVSRNFE